MKKALSFILTIMILMCVTSVTAENNGYTSDIDSSSDPSLSESTEYRLLRTGSSGEDVLQLQLRLNELGYDSGTPDGEFGNATQKAVKAFQRRNQLDVDGIAGKETMRILYSDEAVHAPEPSLPVDVMSGDLPYLVNKDHPVPEDFEPTDLVLISDYCDSSVLKIKYKNTKGVRVAVIALVEMIQDARKAGIKKWQVSAGYRTYNDQDSLLTVKTNQYLKNNSGWSRSKARKAALKTVAEPGESEHHLGLSFDVNVPGTSGFSGTRQCKWLQEHCWEYGFIIRYPKGKEDITGYAYEAWHIRYVGTEHSLIIRDNHFCLEEYIEAIENGTLETVDLD